MSFLHGALAVQSDGCNDAMDLLLLSHEILTSMLYNVSRCCLEGITAEITAAVLAVSDVSAAVRS
jgi:hypothetical protein